MLPLDMLGLAVDVRMHDGMLDFEEVLEVIILR